MIVIIIVIILVLVSYITATDMAYDKGKEKFKENEVLPDLGFELIKDRRSNEYLYKVKEIINAIYLIVFILSIIGNKRAIYEYVITVGIILFLKNILFVSTILPDPSQKCTKFCLSKLYKGSCYDLHISTHSTLLFSSIFVLINNKIYDGDNLMAAIFVNFLIVYIILALRQHYTIDIVNAGAYSFFVNSFVNNSIIPKLF